ncbi:MAG: type IV secretion system protein [Deltaproteobacteria bacterium]
MPRPNRSGLPGPAESHSPSLRSDRDDSYRSTPQLCASQRESSSARRESLSAVPLSASSWQIDWRESSWNRSGQTTGKPVIWRAMLRIVVRAPETTQQMVDNPLGFSLTNFTGIRSRWRGDAIRSG